MKWSEMWPYTRRNLARAWGVPPWVVDDAPMDEVMLELKISSLEAEAEAKRGQS